MKLYRLNFEQFVSAVSFINLPEHSSKEFLFDVYNLVSDTIDALYESKAIPESTTLSLNDIIFYIVGEYCYSIAIRSKEEIEAFNSNEQIKESMAGVVVDKFISLSMFSFKEKKIANKFLPTASSLKLYLNFISNILSTRTKNNPNETLINDLMVKSISLASCVLELLIEGYECEAFATWRTLHESECTLIILQKYGEKAIEAYLKHMKYGIAFKNGFTDKESQDKIFVQIKNEMKAKNLKSKDMKKFIEYGWLYSIEEVEKDETFRLNFRDGLEKIAGLSDYAKRYERSSELIHSTPMLFYANKEYYYFITLLSLYESFFRLEHAFFNSLKDVASIDQLEKYNSLRKVYFSQLINVHKRESNNFINWQKANAVSFDLK